MALRLSGSPTPTTDAAPDTPVRLGDEARAALSRSDLAAYGALFVRAASLDDADTRYRAELMLLEHGLWATRSGETGTAMAIYAAVAAHALTALEREAREPLILNYAGIACYELWALDAAHALFGAAHRLEPELENLARNRSELARRRRAVRPRRPAHPSVPGLLGRARAVADRARPATGMTFSLCMIARDEQRYIGRCLEAIAPAVDELIVVDTGSTDDTVQIARAAGARVIEQPWTGSFSEARNTSFDAATSDWIIYLDADEILVEQDVARLRALSGKVWREAMYITLTNYVGELEERNAVVTSALRIFRNRPHYRFEGRIHEQIGQNLPTGSPGRIAQAPEVRAEHFGYLGETREAKQKSTRNLGLLRQAALEQGTDAFGHYNLACEYASLADYAAAADQYAAGWELLTADATASLPIFAPGLVAGRVKALRLCGRGEEAHSCAQEGLELLPDFTDLVWEQAILARDAGRLDEARVLYERCAALGDAPARYGALLGAGTYLPRTALAIIALEDGRAADAIQLLAWCIEHHPTWSGAIGPYVRARAADGHEPGAIVAEIEQRMSPLTASAQRSLAGALAAIGASGHAARAYAAALAVSEDGASRAALAELLLGLGDYAQAAAHAAALAPDGPYAGQSCRIETCACAAAGDEAGARSALGRASAAGLSQTERDMLDAWIDAEAGAGARPGLPVAGVPLLATLLELVLRAGDDGRFARLAPLLEQSRLAERGRRQLLGEMLLAHGRLAGAAAQWLAVAQEAPDGPALFGLAQVALAQGMTEDAIVFASGAVELDPHHTGARTLLAQVTATAGMVSA